MIPITEVLKIIIYGLFLVVVSLPNSHAIRYGTLDGEEHPNVCHLRFFNDGELREWKCTGTLIHPKLILTAGHCTFNATHARAWFDTDVDIVRNDTNYPYGNDYVPFGAVTTHPDYDDDEFWIHDVGVVHLLSDPILDRPIARTPNRTHIVEEIKGPDRQDAVVSVGYGAQKMKPDPVKDLKRRFAIQNIINARGKKEEEFNLALTNNANTGGACFHDSGGPIFLRDGEKDDLIIAVTSSSLNDNCAGVDLTYRIDQQDDIDFIQMHINNVEAGELSPIA